MLRRKTGEIKKPGHLAGENDTTITESSHFRETEPIRYRRRTAVRPITEPER